MVAAKVVFMASKVGHVLFGRALFGNAPLNKFCGAAVRASAESVNVGVSSAAGASTCGVKLMVVPTGKFPALNCKANWVGKRWPGSVVLKIGRLLGVRPMTVAVSIAGVGIAGADGGFGVVSAWPVLRTVSLINVAGGWMATI